MKDSTGQVSFWDMLTVFSGAAALGGSLSVAAIFKLTGLKLVICVVIGVLGGVLWTWIIWFIGNKVLNFFEGNKNQNKSFNLGWLYMMKFLCLFLSAYINFLITNAVLLNFST